MKRIAAVAVFAVFAYAFIAKAAPDVDPWRSVWELRQHKVPQKFEQNVDFAFVDAGNLSKVGGAQMMSGTLQDGGILGLHCEVGAGTCSSGVYTATFKRAFAVKPLCFCTTIADAGCSLEGPASTTAAVFHGGASSVIDYLCCGTR